MKKFIMLLKKLYDNKSLFYLLLNCVFFVCTISCFMASNSAVGWVFVSLQWVCVYLEFNSGKNNKNS